MSKRVLTALDFIEQTAPATPASGLVRVYAKADGRLYMKDDAGEEVTLAFTLGDPVTALTAVSETYTSTSFGDLATAGPAVTVDHGVLALVIVGARAVHSASTGQGIMSYAISGANTQSASDGRAFWQTGTGFHKSSYMQLLTGLTPGTSTFTAKYRTNSSTATFHHREIIVIPIGV